VDQWSQIIQTLALTMGAGWASGINLYAAVLVLGLLGATGNMTLPPDLMILTHPLVIGAAGTMYAVEFFADKVPGVDNGWDTLHTFIRVPGGALLAAGAVGAVDPAVAVAAGILGGGLAFGTHATKAGSRVLINTSPEPVSNWVVSIAEDILVIGGMWAAVQYPWVFILFLIAFILAMIWLLPKIWRGVKTVGGAIAKWFGRAERRRHYRPSSGEAADVDAGFEAAVAKLNEQLSEGSISKEEYKDKRLQIMERA
jgi:hypothetical protein